MHFPLVIAMLACLMLVLLPVLDRFADSEVQDKQPGPILVRLARWAQE